MNNYEMKYTGSQLLTMAENIEYSKNWRKIRSVFSIIAFNSSDLNDYERRILLTNCYDMLFHPFASIRRQAGETASMLLVNSGESLKELWGDLLHKLLFPGRNLEEQQIRWLTYSLMEIISYASKNMAEEDLKVFLGLYVSYFKSTKWPHVTCLCLISGLLEVHPSMLLPIRKHEIFGFIRQYLTTDTEDINTLSLLLLRQWRTQGWEPLDDEQRYINDFELNDNASFAQVYLLSHLKTNCEQLAVSPEYIPSMVQKDLMMDDDWTSKYTNLNILKDCLFNTASDPNRFKSFSAEYADHLQNILRINEHPIVFMHAGELLLEMMPELDSQQTFEIFQENLKGIETGAYSSNYIPSFLGRSFYYLTEPQQKSFIKRLSELSDSMSEEIAGDTLEIVCLIYYYSAQYNKPVPDSKTLTRIIARGLKDYRETICKEAAFLIRNYLLRKDVTICDPYLADFLAKEIFEKEDILKKEKVAFFSDIFDPFSNKDMAIVTELLNMNFHVCLALNEFSSEQNPQPSRIRRRILNLYAAGIKDVTVLPEEISINTANEKDLQKLCVLYPDSEIYIVSEDRSIDTLEDSAETSWPHIIYSDYDMQGYIDREAFKKIISADTVFMQLPARYQDINASEIRRKVSQNKDISDMVDRRVKNMIVEWRLYIDRPVYRKEAPAKAMMREFSDTEIKVSIGTACGRVVWKTAGNTAVLTEISGDITDANDLRKLALVEFLALCQSKGYSHVVCFEASVYSDILRPFGFTKMNDYADGLTMDMSSATVLFFDVPSFIKEPYNTDERVLSQIRKGQDALQKVLTQLYPGRPVISFHSDILNYQLIQLIRQNIKGTHSDDICVPFGKILKGVNISGVTSKELNIEKQYSPDLYEFDICEMPEYPTLYAQIQTLKSYDRSLMFVDDLFHKGYRFEKISSLFKNEGIAVNKLTTGVISSHGKKLADKMNISVNAVYEIDNMMSWILESDLYPFVGGDGIESYKNTVSHGGAIASINTLLPYQMPTFFKHASTTAVYNLSEVCIENAMQLYKILEDLYFENTHKPLTMERIGEVMAEPRYPSDIIPSAHAADKVSVLLEEEQRKLRRLRHI